MTEYDITIEGYEIDMSASAVKSMLKHNNLHAKNATITVEEKTDKE